MECDCQPCKRRRQRRRRRVVEAPEFAAGARRMVRALGRRAGHGDVEALPLLVALSAEVDEAMHQAVAALRSGEQPYSWTDIGRALGITRQSAQERFSR